MLLTDNRPYGNSISLMWIFQAVAISVLLYSRTTRTLTKHLEKKFDGNFSRKLKAILNKSSKQHPKTRQMCCHLPPITETIRKNWTRYFEHCWKSKWDSFIDYYTWTHQCWLNSKELGGSAKNLIDLDILMECYQMRFIFQHSRHCCPHTSSIGFTLIASHW